MSQAQYRPTINLPRMGEAKSIRDSNAWGTILFDQFSYNEKNEAVMEQSAWAMRNRILKQNFGKQADGYLMSPDEYTFLEQEILGILRWEPCSTYAIEEKSVGGGIKTIESWNWIDVNAPRQTEDFEGGQNQVFSREKTSTSIIGMDYDLHLSKVDLDAQANSLTKMKLRPALEAGQIDNLVDALRYYREWARWRGTDIANSDPEWKDIGITGIVNNAGVNTAALTDATVTTAGDVYAGVVEMAGWLVADKIMPPYEVFMTPKVYLQSGKNVNATSSKTDFQLILEHLGKTTEAKSSWFSGIHMCPFLIDDDETASTGSIAVIKKEPANINYIAKVYEAGVYPLMPTGLGFDAKVLCMEGAVMRRPTAIAYASSITTNT